MVYIHERSTLRRIRLEPRRASKHGTVVIRLSTLSASTQRERKPTKKAQHVYSTSNALLANVRRKGSSRRSRRRRRKDSQKRTRTGTPNDLFVESLKPGQPRQKKARPGLLFIKLRGIMYLMLDSVYESRKERL